MVCTGVDDSKTFQFTDMTLKSKVKVIFTLTCLQLEVYTNSSFILYYAQ